MGETAIALGIMREWFNKQGIETGDSATLRECLAAADVLLAERDSLRSELNTMREALEAIANILDPSDNATGHIDAHMQLARRALSNTLDEGKSI